MEETPNGRWNKARAKRNQAKRYQAKKRHPNKRWNKARAQQNQEKRPHQKATLKTTGEEETAKEGMELGQGHKKPCEETSPKSYSKENRPRRDTQIRNGTRPGQGGKKPGKETSRKSYS